MKIFPERLIGLLNKRKENNNWRELEVLNHKIDFYSNDYLGLAQNKELYLQSKNRDSLKTGTSFLNGSGGSRLIGGHNALIKQLENELSTFYQSQSALVYNSGYTANIGLFSAILQKDDVVLYDEYIHASIKDGMRLGYAKNYKFRHNNTQDLKNKLKKNKFSTKEIYVVVESIYSMDGDQCLLEEIVALKKEYQFHLIVDEAHAVGIIGKYGEGLAASLNLHKQCFARVVTFGKAIGGHGAAILGDELLKEYLVNFSRSFIYTTAPSPDQVNYLILAHQYLKSNNSLIKELQSNINYFKSKIKTNIKGPIQVVLLKDIDASTILKNLKQSDLGIKFIQYPTVPKGKERLRICIHSFNLLEDLDLLIKYVKKYI